MHRRGHVDANAQAGRVTDGNVLRQRDRSGPLQLIGRGEHGGIDADPRLATVHGPTPGDHDVADERLTARHTREHNRPERAGKVRQRRLRRFRGVDRPNAGQGHHHVVAGQLPDVEGAAAGADGHRPGRATPWRPAGSARAAWRTGSRRVGCMPAQRRGDRSGRQAAAEDAGQDHRGAQGAPPCLLRMDARDAAMSQGSTGPPASPARPVSDLTTGTTWPAPPTRMGRGSR